MLVLEEDKEKVLESELKGVTLRVYWHILGVDNKENIGVRQIQRGLGLSSPSVALHHLEKLRTLGLLEKGPRWAGQSRRPEELRRPSRDSSATIPLLFHNVHRDAGPISCTVPAQLLGSQRDGVHLRGCIGRRLMDRDSQGMEDAPVLIVVHPVLTRGIIQRETLFLHKASSVVEG